MKCLNTPLLAILPTLELRYVLSFNLIEGHNLEFLKQQNTDSRMQVISEE